ncbi:MAG: hypothetical protein AVDCRST_MAG59-3090, partial [uncultured Thermomicrobiales bacterium]
GAGEIGAGARRQQSGGGCGARRRGRLHRDHGGRHQIDRPQRRRPYPTRPPIGEEPGVGQEGRHPRPWHQLAGVCAPLRRCLRSHSRTAVVEGNAILQRRERDALPDHRGVRPPPSGHSGRSAPELLDLAGVRAVDPAPYRVRRGSRHPLRSASSTL